MPNPDAHFSAFCTRVDDTRGTIGTVHLAQGVLSFTPEHGAHEAGATYVVATLLRLVLDAGRGELVAEADAGSLRLRMPPTPAAHLFGLLRALAPGAEHVRTGGKPSLPPDTVISADRGQLEITGLLSVSGQIRVTGASVRFEPGLDAQLVGQRAFELPIVDLAPPERLDGGRRVEFRSPQRNVVLRGPGAARAWLVVRVVQDAAGGMEPPVFLECRVEGVVESTGCIGVGERCFGVSGSGDGVLGDSSFWTSFDSLHAIRSGPDGVSIAWGERSVVVVGPSADELVELFAHRWLMSRLAPPSASRWARDAVHLTSVGAEVGRLVHDDDGIAFEGWHLRTLVAPRGSQAAARGDDHDGRVIRVECDGADERFLIGRAADAARVLRGVFSSNGWSAPTADSTPVVLSDSAVSRIGGPASYVAILVGERVLALRRDAVLAPDPEALRLALDFPSVPAALPLAVTFEVANARGRFVVAALLTRVAVAGGASPQRRAVTLQFTSDVRAANRRAFFRLPVREKVPRVEIEPPEGPDGQQASVPLLNVSRRGACLVLDRSWPVGSTCVFSVPLGDAPVELLANVRNVVPAPDETYRTGVQFLPEYEELGARLYSDREVTFLRQRAKSRDRE